jgi:hypothetical protein
MRKKFYKSVIFSNTPLKSRFKHEDEFQIYPIQSSSVPKYTYIKEFPLIIEYWIDVDLNPVLPDDMDTPGGMISRTTNQTNQLNKLMRLLSVLSNHRFYTSPLKVTYGIELPDHKDDFHLMEDKASRAFMTFYNDPIIRNNLKIDSFSKIIGVPPMKLRKHPDYFINNPVEQPEGEIVFPERIGHAFESYFSLSIDEQLLINSCAHLVCNGLDIADTMKSLSFISFVSAIETMVDFDFKRANTDVEIECHDCHSIASSPFTCQKCGKPIWGVKVKFREFLKKYVSSNQNSITKYNRIYNIRSQITHQGLLLLGDERIGWDRSPKAELQYNTYMETRQLSRLSIINWLIKN